MSSLNRVLFTLCAICCGLLSSGALAEEVSP